MRYLPFIGALLILGSLVHCTDNGEPIIINTNNHGDGGNTVGSGVDPSKLASGCYPAFADDELNVVTWNLEFFPLNGTTTWNKVKSILQNLDADIIAVQEIASTSQFVSLASSMQGWEAAYGDVRFSQEIGYLYKRDAFTYVSAPILLFGDDSNAFPREVVRIDATHASGLEVVFLALHLKCCGGDNSSEQDRRRSASVKLKSYIDSNLSNKAVIVLGDWNDKIRTGDISPFSNFISDASNYRFADQGIADGSSSEFSYQNYSPPSHLDHILITNELFSEVGGVQTLKFDGCVSQYYSDVSDHRPVLASFK